MLIEKLTFHNFLCFFGEQTLTFDISKPNATTIVLAPNNSGKTSVIRGLEYLFYGPPDQKWLHNAVNMRARQTITPGEYDKCGVSLAIREGEQTMVLERWVDFEMLDNGRLSLLDQHVQRQRKGEE